MRAGCLRGDRANRLAGLVLSIVAAQALWTDINRQLDIYCRRGCDERGTEGR